MRMKPRPPRIVLVDDDDGVLEMTGIAIRNWSRDATVLLFQDGNEACPSQRSAVEWH